MSSSLPSGLRFRPPPISFTTLSFPTPHILLVTLNRPKQLNCINSAGNAELDRVWTWLDEEPQLRVGIVTGNGRAFCAGADLKGPYTLYRTNTRSLSYTQSLTCP